MQGILYARTLILEKNKIVVFEIGNVRALKGNVHFIVVHKLRDLHACRDWGDWKV